jgi:hypothetical protein
MSDDQTEENLDGNNGSDKPPLITPEQREKLQANGRADRDLDPVPVVKLYDPIGAATWLLTEISPTDPDMAYGLIDLGAGFPRPGQYRLSELSAIAAGPLGIKRDERFMATHRLSAYAEAARIRGVICRQTRRSRTRTRRHRSWPVRRNRPVGGHR